jgi:uncharacterized metal-binding protein YceD (DUF177 family)
MSGWSHTVRLSELARGPVSVTLEPDEASRAAIAKQVGLEGLPAFSGRLTVRSWLDGAEIVGRFKARVEQICSVSLDPFEQELDGEMEVRVVPPGSPNAPADSAQEVELNLDAPDPPDVLKGEEIDLAAYLVEHLALEIDPFPRKPGATFDYTPDTQEESPFAVLKRLRGEGE